MVRGGKRCSAAQCGVGQAAAPRIPSSAGSILRGSKVQTRAAPFRSPATNRTESDSESQLPGCTATRKSEGEVRKRSWWDWYGKADFNKESNKVKGKYNGKMRCN
eukprot:754437-Hanusia_phi.AAC.8